MSLDKFFPMQMFWFVFGRFVQVQGQLQRNLAVKACGISSYQWHSVTTSWLFLEPLKETKKFLARRVCTHPGRSYQLKLGCWLGYSPLEALGGTPFLAIPASFLGSWPPLVFSSVTCASVATRPSGTDCSARPFHVLRTLVIKIDPPE